MFSTDTCIRAESYRETDISALMRTGTITEKELGRKGSATGLLNDPMPEADADLFMLSARE